MIDRADLRRRVITAVVLAALVAAAGILSALSCGSRWWAAGLAFLVCAISAWEFATICSGGLKLFAQRAFYLLVMILPGVLLAAGAAGQDICEPAFVRSDGIAMLLASFVAAFVFASLYLSIRGRSRLEEAQVVAGELFTGLHLIGFCGAALMLAALHAHGFTAIVWLLLVVAANDTAAFFGGKKLQGPPLAPALSPNKTISGGVSGLISAVLIGVLFFWLLPGAGIRSALLLALAVAVAGQTGDLMKSYVKRVHSCKDSGTILPGHGGLLDRIDGVLMGSPLLLSWLLFAA